MNYYLHIAHIFTAQNYMYAHVLLHICRLALVSQFLTLLDY